MAITLIALLLLIYLLSVFTSSERKLNIQTTKIIRASFLVLAPFLIALLILSRFNIYPRGYWITKILFWTVIFSMMILFRFGNRSTLNKFERILYKFFFYLPLGFIPLLFIPFLGGAIALLIYVSFIGDQSFIVYTDDNIRIEIQGVRFLGPDPPLEIYVKDGLFSHKDTILRMGYDSEKDSLSVRRLNESTYSLIHYSPDNWQVPAGFEEFKYSLIPK
jgi:hypothetical protein